MVEHKNMSSSIGKHYKDKHCTVPKDLDKQFSVLKKHNNKFDCLGHEMLLIRELSPSPIGLNSSKTFCVTLHISYMLIISQKNVLAVYRLYQQSF